MNVGTKATREGHLAHLQTLRDIVADYRKRFRYTSGAERSEGHHDPVVDFAKEAPDLRTAISRAVAGRRRDGKMFSEDSMVRASSKAELEAKLQRRHNALLDAMDFEALHDFIQSQAPWGCGRLIVYNVAARIGAFFRIEPEDYVYLHAGPLRAWKKLTGSRSSPVRVPVAELPRALRALPPHQIEDLLCEYRDLLHPEMNK